MLTLFGAPQGSLSLTFGGVLSAMTPFSEPPFISKNPSDGKMIQKSLYLYFSGEFLRCSEVVLGVFSQKKQCFWFFCGESSSLFQVFLSIFSVFLFSWALFLLSRLVGRRVLPSRGINL